MLVSELEALEELALVEDELAVRLKLDEEVPVKKLEGVSVAEGEGVRALDALRRLAMLRPR